RSTWATKLSPSRYRSIGMPTDAGVRVRSEKSRSTSWNGVRVRAMVRLLGLCGYSMASRGCRHPVQHREPPTYSKAGPYRLMLSASLAVRSARLPVCRTCPDLLGPVRTCPHLSSYACRMGVEVLLSGFEPFGGEAANPSWEAVRRAGPVLRERGIATVEAVL